MRVIGFDDIKILIIGTSIEIQSWRKPTSKKTQPLVNYLLKIESPKNLKRLQNDACMVRIDGPD